MNPFKVVVVADMIYHTLCERTPNTLKLMAHVPTKYQRNILHFDRCRINASVCEVYGLVLRLVPLHLMRMNKMIICHLFCRARYRRACSEMIHFPRLGKSIRFSIF